MNKISKALIVAILAIAFCLQFACSSVGGLKTGDAEYAGKATPSGLNKPDSTGETAPDDASGEGESKDSATAGQLTAGAHNDNEYYGDWLKLFEDAITEPDSQEQAKTPAKFNKYKQSDFKLFSLFRVKVTVRNGELPVEGATVTCSDDKDETLYSAVTDANGTAYLFPKKSGGIITAKHSGKTITTDYSYENNDLTLELGNAEADKQKLIQLMFVIDATGSMGDEMSYLKAELGDVIRRVVEKNDNDVKVQLALLFYRDDGDSEKFAYSDFADVTQPEKYATMQKILAKQSANGGGDYEEALDEAMQLAVSKQWSDNSTKLIFNLLDAPCHGNERNALVYSTAVYEAAKKGIRICPILASGADLFTEYLTRQAAILTGGTFTFITDDSGIGGSHLDPELPNVTVELLNDMLVRLIDGYYTGKFAAPVYWKDAVKAK